MKTPMDDNKWIEDLRHEEENFLPELPEGLWHDIETKLPAHKPHRVFLSWLRYGGVAASVAIAFGVGFHFLQPSVRSDLHNVSPSIPLQHAAPVHQATVSSASLLKVSRPEAVCPLALAKPLKKDDEKSVNVTIAPEAVQRPDEQDGRGQAQPDRKASVPEQEKRQVHSSEERHPIDSSFEQPIKVRTHSPSRRKPVFSIHVGNLAMGNNSGGKAGYGPMTTLGIYENFTGGSIGVNPFNDILVLNQGRNVSTTTHYRLPARFGLSVNFPLTDRLALESGITYTQLSQTEESGTETNYFEIEQKLHYLGIPLKLHCKVWENRFLRLYVAGGGMVEQCVGGNATTQYVVGGKERTRTEQRVNENRPQFSTILSAGIEARITSRVSLFAEPGASYHFDNHSRVDNSYKGKPFNFDLKVGLRLNVE